MLVHAVSVEANMTSSSKHINYANHDWVVLTGSTLLGKVGPLIGSFDIAESDNDYVFRVSLPDVVRDEKHFSSDVGPNGIVFIKGVSVTGENKVIKNNVFFKMQSQSLCPPREFSISFQLPGPVDDHENLNSYVFVFGSGGIFEGVVTKIGQQIL
ncbi:alpha-crystallin domain-containing protein 22.3-like [Capsicum galapagoense]